MVLSVWKAGASDHFPGLIGLGFSVGLRYSPAPREQSGAIYLLFWENRLTAWLAAQCPVKGLRFLPVCQEARPLASDWSLSQWVWQSGVAGWSTEYPCVSLHPGKYLFLLQPASHHMYSDKVNSKSFQQMSEYLLCARHCLAVSEAKWK